MNIFRPSRTKGRGLDSAPGRLQGHERLFAAKRREVCLNSWASAYDNAPRYAAFNTGGCDGLISANATCTMPPARPSATPMRQAMV